MLLGIGSSQHLFGVRRAASKELVVRPMLIRNLAHELHRHGVFVGRVVRVGVFELGAVSAKGDDPADRWER